MPSNDKKNPDDDFLWWIIILIIILASSSDAQSTPAHTDTGQAGARLIIARHDSVSGRSGGVSRHRYSHTISETAAPSIKTVTEVWVAPNRTLTRMTMNGVGTTEIGYNGSIGWTSSPMTGPVLL